MSKIININAIFDTETILEKYGPGGQPERGIGIYHDDVYMVTEKDNLFHPSSQATANLWIKADLGDVVRWRSVSVSGDVSQSVIIYKLVRFEGPPDNLPIMRTPEPNLAMPWRPIPQQDASLNVDPLKFNAMQIPDYFLSSAILKSGWEGDEVHFYITQEKSGRNIEILGYYRWDPRITVN
ncbi:AidA/PixA family protein [Chromobacterium vaccinii]|uniref:AidA/PixA family protein n=1 Tax=Chromobacterium vaccinii TaxID=1108595 RepID=UPI001364BBF6|nr:AidA/PixA family protein [Chromobacterium vaccinii]